MVEILHDPACIVLPYFQIPRVWAFKVMQGFYHQQLQQKPESRNMTVPQPLCLEKKERQHELFQARTPIVRGLL